MTPANSNYPSSEVPSTYERRTPSHFMGAPSLGICPQVRECLVGHDLRLLIDDEVTAGRSHLPCAPPEPKSPPVPAEPVEWDVLAAPTAISATKNADRRVACMETSAECERGFEVPLELSTCNRSLGTVLV